jgi:hypothetical protein
VASACGSTLKRIFQVFAHSARLTLLHMPGGNRLLNWPTALTSTRMTVNGTAIGDDHVTRSRRPELDDLRNFRSAPDIRCPPLVIGDIFALPFVGHRLLVTLCHP